MVMVSPSLEWLSGDQEGPVFDLHPGTHADRHQGRRVGRLAQTGASATDALLCDARSRDLCKMGQIYPQSGTMLVL